MQPAASVPTDEERKNKYASLDRITEEPEFCERGTCRQRIHTMSFKGTGVCGERCRKVRDGEATVTERPKGAT